MTPEQIANNTNEDIIVLMLAANDRIKYFTQFPGTRIAGTQSEDAKLVEDCKAELLRRLEATKKTAKVNQTAEPDHTLFTLTATT